MGHEIGDVRLVTASAYPGLMGGLVSDASAVCVLSGDADTDALVPATVARQSLEVLAGVRRRWQAGDVSGLADFVPKVLAGAPRDPRPLLIVAPRVGGAWRRAAAAWPEEIAPLDRFDLDQPRIAEDKAYVREELHRLGVPTPTSRVFAPLDLSFRRARAAVRAPFVLQAPNSAGGQGTYLVCDEGDLLATLGNRPDVERWLVSAYAGEVTVNVAGVVYADGFQILPASVQSSAIAEVGVGFGAYCGSDFGAAAGLPDSVRADAYRYTARIAEWLHRCGYRGLFGADIAVAGGQLAFLEINPRIQGSSWLLDSVRRGGDGTGCLSAHVRAVLGAPAPSGQEGPPETVAGSQLIVRWTGPSGVVRSVAGPRRDARHRVTGLPLTGTVLAPRAIIARIASPHSIVEASGTVLTSAGRRLVSEILASVEVTPS